MENNEKRIYVVVAETVQNPDGKRIVQVCGRNMAQCAHVVSGMQVKRITAPPALITFESCTTIVLAARDSKEMEHIRRLLRTASISHEVFHDTNLEVYETKEEIFTAICTQPIEAVQVEGILDYLPLWGHSKEIL